MALVILRQSWRGRYSQSLETFSCDVGRTQNVRQASCLEMYLSDLIFPLQTGWSPTLK